MKKRISFVCCPKCKIYTFQKIISTVVNEEHKVVRRRVCLDCEYRWYTYQTPEKTINNLKAGYLMKTRLS